MSELKKCPFCGSSDWQDMAGYISCESCFADGPNAEDYSEAWNKRFHPTCSTCKWFSPPNECRLFSLLLDDDFYCKGHEEKTVEEIVEEIAKEMREGLKDIVGQEPKPEVVKRFTDRVISIRKDFLDLDTGDAHES